MSVVHCIGRRKSSVARIFLSKGKGKITVNTRGLEEYFPTILLQNKILEPFQVTDTLKKFNVTATVKGGGNTGQAEAIRLGISRALTKIEESYRSQLKPAKLLSRNSKIVERKKYGRKKARKKFQFSKR